jgi:hypothetical protein
MQKEPEGVSNDPLSSTPPPNLPPPRYYSTGMFSRVAPPLAWAAELISTAGCQLTASPQVCCYDLFFLTGYNNLTGRMPELCNSGPKALMQIHKPQLGLRKVYGGTNLLSRSQGATAFLSFQS